MNEPTIETRSRSRDRDEFDSAFAALPGNVRRDPHRVGLAPEAVWRGMLTLPLPAPSEFWLGRAGGQPIVRLGANVSAMDPGRGYLGFYEADLQHPGAEITSRRLMETALRWLGDHGVRQVYGPVCFNTWMPYRFRTNDESDPWRFSWEPVNPPAYVTFFRDSGFEDACPYHSHASADWDGFINGTRAGHEAAIAAGYSFRSLDGTRVLDDEVPILHRLSLDAFADSFLFEPIPLDVFRALYVPLSGRADLSLCSFLLDPAGKECGFVFAYADGDYLIIKTLAVARRYQGKGLASAILHRLAIESRRRGIPKMVHALIRAGNPTENFNRKARLEWRHEYTVFSRAINTLDS